MSYDRRARSIDGTAGGGSAEMLEPAIPLLLSALGVVSALSVGGGALEIALVLLVGTVGVAGLLGWRGTAALAVRASVLTAVAFALPLLDIRLVPHTLQWWYAIIAVYPLLLVRGAVAVSLLAAGAMLSQYALGTATPGVTVQSWSLRAVLLASIGLIVARAGSAYRAAQGAAQQRRQAAEAAERELHHVTTHDALTGMPNRASLDHFVDVALHERTGDPDDEVALLLLDLDRFKNVNETLGHLAGDRLLREVAERLVTACGPGQRAVRLGGDEFAVVCAPTGLAAAEAAGQRLVRLFDQPVELGGAPYRIGLSVGVAVSGDGIQTRGDLLRAADAAMYAAKRRGRGRAVSFDTTMSEDVAANLAVEQQLRDAINRGGELEGELHPDAVTAVYQPVVDLRTGRVIAAEALARWQLGGQPVSPLRFVPLAEELGLGVQLATVIACQSLRALASWHREGLTHVASVAVNISAADLLTPGLPDRLAGLVAEAGLPPGSLSLEITERDVVDDVERTREALQRLRERGITVAVDDFGTGFSSLAYLARLPLHVLKIDREFVAQLDVDDTIARTVVQLANSFGMQCIAEGVETPQQLDALAELGVQAGQGWHLGRPTDAAGFVPAVRRRGSAVRPAQTATA